MRKKVTTDHKIVVLELLKDKSLFNYHIGEKVGLSEKTVRRIKIELGVDQYTPVTTLEKIQKNLIEFPESSKESKQSSCRGNMVISCTLCGYIYGSESNLDKNVTIGELQNRHMKGKHINTKVFIEQTI